MSIGPGEQHHWSDLPQPRSARCDAATTSILRTLPGSPAAGAENGVVLSATKNKVIYVLHR